MDRFWDIESYDNLFCVSFLDDNDHLDMFHLCADEDVADVERACRGESLPDPLQVHLVYEGRDGG